MVGALIWGANINILFHVKPNALIHSDQLC
ncbi:MAG: hypothetical protein RL063_999 [Pseudomonadota bacterium]